MTATPPPEDQTALLRQALTRIHELEEYVDWAQPLLEEWEKWKKDNPPETKPAPPKKPAPKPKPQFDNAISWVQEWFLPTFQRRVGGSSRWCSMWWAHTEALVRFEALWRTWEVLRLDPGTGLGVWLRDYLNPELGEILAAAGPFGQCTPESHEPLKRFPAVPAPAELVTALTIKQPEQNPTIKA